MHWPPSPALHSQRRVWVPGGGALQCEGTPAPHPSRMCIHPSLSRRATARGAGMEVSWVYPRPPAPPAWMRLDAVSVAACMRVHAGYPLPAPSPRLTAATLYTRHYAWGGTALAVSLGSTYTSPSGSNVFDSRGIPVLRHTSFLHPSTLPHKNLSLANVFKNIWPGQLPKRHG